MWKLLVVTVLLAPQGEVLDRQENEFAMPSEAACIAALSNVKALHVGDKDYGVDYQAKCDQSRLPLLAEAPVAKNAREPMARDFSPSLTPIDASKPFNEAVASPPVLPRPLPAAHDNADAKAANAVADAKPPVRLELAPTPATSEVSNPSRQEVVPLPRKRPPDLQAAKTSVRPERLKPAVVAASGLPADDTDRTSAISNTPKAAAAVKPVAGSSEVSVARNRVKKPAPISSVKTPAAKVIEQIDGIY